MWGPGQCHSESPPNYLLSLVGLQDSVIESVWVLMVDGGRRSSSVWVAPSLGNWS